MRSVAAMSKDSQSQPAGNDCYLGFGRQMPTADAPCVHTMKGTNELKLVPGQLCLRYK